MPTKAIECKADEAVQRSSARWPNKERWMEMADWRLFEISRFRKFCPNNFLEN